MILAAALPLLTACDYRSGDMEGREIYRWSHNDYYQPEPLMTAVRQGFQMVEADIHLVDGKLYVAHDPPDTSKTPVLEELYLEPLSTLSEQRNGRIQPTSTLPFYLVMDVKTGASETYEVVTEVLLPYRHLFTRLEDGERIEGAVNLLISGNRPQLNGDDPFRMSFIDGRIPDLGKGYSTELYPVISDNWGNYFTWDGTGTIPEQEYDMLESLVSQAHDEGKLIRFWATPDSDTMWEVLTSAGVDIINADDVTGLQQFLDEKQL